MYGTWDPSWDFQHVQVMLNKTSSLLDLLGTILGRGQNLFPGMKVNSILIWSNYSNLTQPGPPKGRSGGEIP